MASEIDTKIEQTKEKCRVLWSKLRRLQDLGAEEHAIDKADRELDEAYEYLESLKAKRV